MHVIMYICKIRARGGPKDVQVMRSHRAQNYRGTTIIIIARTWTFFTKQSSTMNRKVGHNFEIPPGSRIYLRKILVPVQSRWIGNERGTRILQQIGIGIITILSMATAGSVERNRLRMQKEFIPGGRVGKLSMSVFWLAPRYIVIGIGDGITNVLQLHIISVASLSVNLCLLVESDGKMINLITLRRLNLNM